MDEVDNEMAPLIAALAKARGEFPDIPRSRTAVVRMKNGGQYSYNYADLADVFSAIDPALAAHGLSVRQFPKDLSLVTEIWHESGGVLRSEWPIKPMPQRGVDDACRSPCTAETVAAGSCG